MAQREAPGRALAPNHRPTDRPADVSASAVVTPATRSVAPIVTPTLPATAQGDPLPWPSAPGCRRRRRLLFERERASDCDNGRRLNERPGNSGQPPDRHEIEAIGGPARGRRTKTRTRDAIHGERNRHHQRRRHGLRGLRMEAGHRHREGARAGRKRRTHHRSGPLGDERGQSVKSDGQDGHCQHASRHQRQPPPAPQTPRPGSRSRSTLRTISLRRPTNAGRSAERVRDSRTATRCRQRAYGRGAPLARRPTGRTPPRARGRARVPPTRRRDGSPRRFRRPTASGGPSRPTAGRGPARGGRHDRGPRRRAVRPGGEGRRCTGEPARAPSDRARHPTP